MVHSSFIAAVVGNQYKAALDNLGNIIQKFPEELWTQEKDVLYLSWRIAYHIIYYAKFYLSPNPYEMQAWPEAYGVQKVWAAPGSVNQNRLSGRFIPRR